MNQFFTNQLGRSEFPRICLLATLLLSTIGLVTSPATAQAPTVIIMPGIIRDFQRAHPDFDITPSGGYGHYAGNIAMTISASQTPVSISPARCSRSQSPPS